jgi:transposase-like protein
MEVEQLDIGRKPDAPDWAQIRIDFEAGDVSTREIARRHDISDTAIHKRAKAEQWKGLQAPQTEGANHDAPPLQTELQTTIAKAVER